MDFELNVKRISVKYKDEIIGTTTPLFDLSEIALLFGTKASSLAHSIVEQVTLFCSKEGGIFVPIDDFKSTLEAHGIQPDCMKDCGFYPCLAANIVTGEGAREVVYRFFELNDICIKEKNDDLVLGHAVALLNIEEYASKVGVEGRGVVYGLLVEKFPVFSINDELFMSARDIGEYLENSSEAEDSSALSVGG